MKLGTSNWLHLIKDVEANGRHMWYDAFGVRWACASVVSFGFPEVTENHRFHFVAWQDPPGEDYYEMAPSPDEQWGDTREWRAFGFGKYAGKKEENLDTYGALHDWLCNMASYEPDVDDPAYVEPICVTVEVAKA